MTLNEVVKRRAAGLPPPCVEKAKNAPTLSVHLNGGEGWILPWSRFCHAHLAKEELTLTFTDVDVVVRGQNLNVLVQEAAALGIEAMRALPAQYRPIIPPNETFISDIEIVPTTESADS